MDVWVKLYDPSDKWYTRKLRSIRWRVAGLLRKLKHGPSGIAAWMKMNRRCKELNRALIAEAERIAREPKYPAPTPEEIQDFIDWSQAHGVIYDNRVTKVKHPKDSKYVDISV